jgi:hypothetical protein
MQPFTFSPLGILRCSYAYFFDLARSRGDRFRSPAFNASITVAFLVYFNLLTVGFNLARAHVLGGWFLTLPKSTVLIVAFGILGLTHLYFGNRRRHDALVAAFDAADPDIKQRAKVVSWTYVFGSLGAFLLLGIYWGRHA